MLKKNKIIAVVLFFVFIAKLSYADPEIRIAILDNFRYQKYVTTNYKTYYTKGLNLAAKEAKKNGYLIKYQIFQYDQTPLSIFDALIKAQEWNPDIIIGPRDSNQFLLLSSRIDDVLTLSPFATSTKILSMPSNFYSLTLPDSYTATAMFEFISKYFPNKNIFVITEANCKSCTDVSDQIISIWKKEKNSTPNQTFYVQDNIPDPEVLLKNFTRGDIIILPNMAHSSAVLMATLTNYLNTETIFVGGDAWGAWNDTEVGKLKSKKPYTAFHIVPWSLESCDLDLLAFKKLYIDYYHEDPLDKLSFISFSTINSIVSAYKIYGNQFSGSMREKLLASYQLALEEQPLFHKPVNYLIYKMENYTNQLIASINISDGKVESMRKNQCVK